MMNPSLINKYEYIIKNPWKVKLLYISGMITWASVVYGYINFFKLSPIYWYILAPFVFYFTVYYYISYFIGLFYKKFDVEHHNKLAQKFWFNYIKKNPSVDIFLPICGEDSVVIYNTFLAVSKLAYKNYQVYVLDDKGNETHKQYAQEFNFHYLSRENKGEMKKAGNLKYGFERSFGEFIVIFDADFAPHPDFIKEALPYMNDEKVAIVQTPQYFEVNNDVHKNSPLQYGAGQVQEDFYRIIQVSRDYFGAAICVGSNAIYRRSALDMVGGTAQIEYSEDVHTGVSLMKLGWKIKYIPLILAVGLCPDRMHPFFMQQHRWCNGSMSLLFNKSFWKSNITIFQKMCFSSGFLYYISQIIILILSFQAFLLLLTNYEGISLLHALPFFPALIFGILVRDRFRLKRRRYGSFLVRTAYLYAYIHAFFSQIFNFKVGWQATNEKHSRISKAYQHFMLAILGYLSLYIFLFGIVIALHRFNILNIQHVSINFWIVYFITMNLIFIFPAYREALIIKKEEALLGTPSDIHSFKILKYSFYFGIPVLFILLFVSGMYAVYLIEVTKIFAL